MVDMIAILIAFTVGSLLTLLAYSKGLQHNYELKNNTKPSIDNPVSKVIEHKQEVKRDKEAQTLIDEWLNGKAE